MSFCRDRAGTGRRSRRPPASRRADARSMESIGAVITYIGWSKALIHSRERIIKMIVDGARCTRWPRSVVISRPRPVPRQAGCGESAPSRRAGHVRPSRARRRTRDRCTASGARHWAVPATSSDGLSGVPESKMRIPCGETRSKAAPNDAAPSIRPESSTRARAGSAWGSSA